jgi:hypothetical protein
MGFLFGLLFLGAIGALVFYYVTYNGVVEAENAVEKHLTDLLHVHQSAADLLNDLVISILTYGHEERAIADRYYAMLEKSLSMGLAGGAMVMAPAINPSPAPSQLADLYLMRMRELSRLHDMFNEHMQRFTSALANYKNLRWGFPAGLIPDAFIGASKSIPELGNRCVPFIDIRATQELITSQRQLLSSSLPQ